MGRRTLLLIAAFLVAALGTTMVFLYVNGLEDKYLQDQEPQEVLVAKGPIPANTTGADAQSQGLFDIKKMAKRDVAPGAVSSSAQIADEVALAQIYPGEQILADKFGTTSSTGALTIPSGKLAVSVQLSDQARVAGFVEPGSHVTVFLTTAPAAGPGNDLTAVLLPDVQVLGVGQSTAVTTTTKTPEGAQTTEQIPRAILTLALSESDAAKIVHGQTHGELYFALRDEKTGSIKAGQPTTSADLFN